MQCTRYCAGMQSWSRRLGLETYFQMSRSRRNVGKVSSRTRNQMSRSRTTRSRLQVKYFGLYTFKSCFQQPPQIENTSFSISKSSSLFVQLSTLCLKIVVFEELTVGGLICLPVVIIWHLWQLLFVFSTTWLVRRQLQNQ